MIKRPGESEEDEEADVGQRAEDKADGIKRARPSVWTHESHRYYDVQARA